MKKCMIIVCLALAYQLPMIALDKVSDKEKLETAIDQSNVLLVERLVKRMGSITAAVKQEFVVHAEDVLTDRENLVSLLNSSFDLVQCASGAAVGLFTAGAAYFFAFGRKGLSRPRRQNPGAGHAIMMSSSDDDEISIAGRWIPALMSLGLSSGSFYVAFKGAQCTKAKERVAKAQRVLEMVGNMEVSGVRR